MTSIEDTRWRHLVDEHAFDQIEFTLDQRTQRVRPFALTAGATGSPPRLLPRRSQRQ
jgi:hypothetical protein